MASDFRERRRSQKPSRALRQLPSGVRQQTGFEIPRRGPVELLRTLGSSERGATHERFKRRCSPKQCPPARNGGGVKESWSRRARRNPSFDSRRFRDGERGPDLSNGRVLRGSMSNGDLDRITNGRAGLHPLRSNDAVTRTSARCSRRGTCLLAGPSLGSRDPRCSPPSPMETSTRRLAELGLRRSGVGELPARTRRLTTVPPGNRRENGNALPANCTDRRVRILSLPGVLAR